MILQWLPRTAGTDYNPRPGCRLLSARDLQEDIELAAARLRGEYLEQQKTEKSYLLDSMSEEVRRQISACQQMETIQEDE